MGIHFVLTQTIMEMLLVLSTIHVTRIWHQSRFSQAIKTWDFLTLHYLQTAILKRVKTWGKKSMHDQSFKWEEGFHLLNKIWGLKSNNLFASAALLYHASKKSTWPVTGLGNRGPLKILNDTKLDPNEHEWLSWLFRNSSVSLRTFRNFWFPKPIIGQVLFWAHGTVKRL